MRSLLFSVMIIILLSLILLVACVNPLDVTEQVRLGIAGFELVYQPNGATGGDVPELSRHVAGVQVAVFANPGNLRRAGYSWIGWNSRANGSGDDYTGGESFIMPESDLALYAQWSINQYSFGYNMNGGTGTAPAGGTFDYNTSLVVADAAGITPPDGHNFYGWNTRQDGNGTHYDPGDSMSIPAQNSVLYAQWTTSDQYRLNFSAGVGTGSAPEEVRAWENHDYTLPFPENLIGQQVTGRTTIRQRFTGWSSDGGVTVLPAGHVFTMPSADVTMVAQWTSDDSILGKVGPAGGYIFYHDSAEAYPWLFLEAASPSAVTQAVWGGKGTSVENTQNGFGSGGGSSTLRIVDALGTTGSYAALVAHNYELSGKENTYTDWYLPNADELGQITANLYSTGLYDEFTGFFCSSLQYDATRYRAYKLSDASSSLLEKDLACNVLPVRAGNDEPANLFLQYYAANGGGGAEFYDYIVEGVSFAVPGQGELVGPEVIRGEWRENQLLERWDSKPGGDGNSYAVGASVSPTTPSIFFAQWTVIGMPGPGKGLIFYDYGSEHLDGWRYLEAAARDEGESTQQSWGSRGKTVGANDNTIGKGKENTQAIIDNTAVD
ncbi:MAG: hypothetical protein D6B26_08120, partial [Spirochaetaceae bacterium]